MTTSNINNIALTGDALLAKVTELKDSSTSDKVRACGYVSIKEGGVEKLDFTRFYESLLAAKGVETKPLPTAEEIAAKRKAMGDKEMTFNVSIPVTCYYQVVVKRPANFCADDVIDSITREDLTDNGEGEMTWDDIKDAWRSVDSTSAYVTDSDGEEVA